MTDRGPLTMGTLHLRHPDGREVQAGDLVAGHGYDIDTVTGVVTPNDTRIHVCPACGGDGIFCELIGQDPLTGVPISQEAECSCCGGTGEVQTEVEPIEMEDLG